MGSNGQEEKLLNSEIVPLLNDPRTGTSTREPIDKKGASAAGIA